MQPIIALLVNIILNPQKTSHLWKKVKKNGSNEGVVLVIGFLQHLYLKLTTNKAVHQSATHYSYVQVHISEVNNKIVINSHCRRQKQARNKRRSYPTPVRAELFSLKEYIAELEFLQRMTFRQFIISSSLHTWYLS